MVADAAVDLTDDGPDHEAAQGAGDAAPTAAPDASDVYESNQCCICSETWHCSGPRRVVALRQCGHLFCHLCISQWFNNGNRGTSSVCPICRKKSKSKDIVPLIVHGLPLAGPDAARVQCLEKDKAKLEKELKRLRQECQKHENQSAATSMKLRKLEEDMLSDNTVGRGHAVPTQPRGLLDPKAASLAASIESSNRLVIPSLAYREATAIAQNAEQGLLFLGAKLPNHPDKAVLVKQSLHYVESRAEISLTGSRCWDIATQAPCAGVSDGFVAAACGSGVAIVQAADEHIVAYISTPEVNSNCRAVAWRSEHQLWASQKDTVKLFDIRNLKQAVTSYGTDNTIVHSLSAAREGVIAGTARGSWAMALKPDGCVVPLTVRGMSREAAGSCFSTCTVTDQAAGLTDVVTSFRRCGDTATPDQAREHHTLGSLSHSSAASSQRWTAGSQVHGFESVLTQARSAVLRVPVGGGTVLAVLSGDEATGAVRVWAAAHGTSQAVHAAGDLADEAGGAGNMHVRHVTASTLANGSWLVSALRTKALTCGDASLTVYRIPAA